MSRHVHEWLDGLKGIELGRGAHNDFGLVCWNVSPDDEPSRAYHDAERDACGRVAPIDRVDDGATLATFADSSLDFIFSSHVFEHLPNPLGALGHWQRVLKPGGIVYMIVPQRDAAALDRGRELTTLAHLEEDLARGETLATHPVPPGGHLKGGHYHVFSPASLIAIIDAAAPTLELAAVLNPDDQVGNGFALVYRNRKPQ